jgi:hypothetical protein
MRKLRKNMAASPHDVLKYNFVLTANFLTKIPQTTTR